MTENWDKIPLFFLLLLGYHSIGSSKNYLKWLIESPRIFLRLFGISTRNINDSLFIEYCEIQKFFENSNNEVHPSPSAIYVFVGIPQWCMPKILSGDVKSILRQPVCEWDRAVEGFIIFKSMNQ